MAQISAKEVANGVGLPANELSKPCDGGIIPSLANCFSRWRVIFGSLLSDLDLGDIDRENPTKEEKRIAALRKWKARNGYKGTYKVLVDTLLNEGERYQAESLCKILADHLSHKTETTTTDSDVEESEADIIFRCPCGECSLETYLQYGCPMSGIPYLGMTTLSKEDQENLNYMLKKDTKKIIKNFADLYNRTCDSLIRQKVPVEKLVRVVVKFNPSLRDELKKSKSIDEVFTDLAPEMSFFRHETLAEIINVFGDQDDRDCLAHYSKEFKDFCKRRVFEVEPGHCTCGLHLSNLKQRKLFAVVLPTGENMFRNLGDAVSIKEMLADDLGIPPATFHLHQIGRDSVTSVRGADLFSQIKDVMKPLSRRADVHEPSSKHVPTIPSNTPGELLVSGSLPTSAHLFVSGDMHSGSAISTFSATPQGDGVLSQSTSQDDDSSIPIGTYTVEPLYNGHFGAGHFCPLFGGVLYWECGCGLSLKPMM